jgi:hypothetical protein
LTKRIAQVSDLAEFIGLFKRGSSQKLNARTFKIPAAYREQVCGNISGGFPSLATGRFVVVNEANVKQSLLYAKAADGAIYLLAMMPDGRWAILRDGLLIETADSGAQGADRAVDRFVALSGVVPSLS